MTIFGERLKQVFALGFALLLGSSACLAQQPAPPPRPAGESGFHRMEIYNGPNRTVYHIPIGASAADQAKMRDADRAENDAALADQLASLRRQYVSDESFLQARRTNVQQLLYGYSSQTNFGYDLGWGGWGWGGYGGYLNYFGYGYPYFGYGASSSNSLMWGIGDEGVIKRELARTLAVPYAAPPQK
jgi:hypothetical protein